MLEILLIALLGVFGVLCRYGAELLIPTSAHNFPVSTLIVNILGSLLAGSIYALSANRFSNSILQTGLLVGFCGGFSTFSAYTLQTVTMIERGNFLSALLYFFISPSVGLLAAYVPVFIFRKL